MTLKESIEQVLKEGGKEKLPLVPLSEIADILEEYDVEFDSDDFETNGWQVDWWQYFEYNDERYCIAGSIYYGDYSISKEDD